MTKTIDEAIGILQKDIVAPSPLDIMDVKEAEQLGIEALKKEQRRRLITGNIGHVLLPGETKE